MKNKINKKVIAIAAILALALSIFSGTASYAAFKDVPQGAAYADAAARMEAFGIMSGDSSGRFNPDLPLTREGFAKVIVTASGLDDAAASLKGSTVFPDVKGSSWSSGYVNEAVSKGFMAGMADGRFHPSDPVTFAMACTVLVRALGYTDTDVPGVQPQNYIAKAAALGLTDGINLKAGDALPRWAAAMMTDRLLDTAVKKQNASEADRKFSDTTGAFTQTIVLGTPATLKKLSGKQVQTDKGVLYNNTGVSFEPGGKYNIVLSDSNITKSSKSVSVLLKISVLSATDNTVTYTDAGSGKNIDLTLPDSAAYYYNGQKTTYDNLKNILQARSSVILAYNSDRSGFDYGLVFDPVYSKPAIASGPVGSSGKIGSLDITEDIAVLRNSVDYISSPSATKAGEVIKASQIAKNNLVYKVTDIWGGNPYILVVDNRVEGKMTSILPGRASPKTIQIDGKNYDIGSDMDVTKISGSAKKYKVDEKVDLLLGYDGKAADIAYPDGTYLNSRIIIMGTAATSSKLTGNQVLTDNGVLNNNTKTVMEPGCEYDVALDGSNINKSAKSESVLQKISVQSLNDAAVTYADNGRTLEMTLPDSATYYYNGQKTTKDNVKNSLQPRSSLILAYNSDKSDYDYVVVFDPVYSKPEKARGSAAGASKIGSVDISGGIPILRNSVDYTVSPSVTKTGEVIDSSQVKENNLVYRVSDIWGGNPYVLVVDNKVEGKITSILPGRASPKTIQIDSKNYDFGSDMNISKISSSTGMYKVDETVDVLLGYDGKVADILYPDSQAINYAFVMNASSVTGTSSADYGVTTYSVKLLLPDGTTGTYKTATNCSSMKGTVVKYAMTDSQTVALASIGTMAAQDYAIRKDDRLLGKYYVSDSVRIFNIISNVQGTDAQANLVNWSALPDGTLASGKVTYVLKSGVFDDVVMMVMNDVFNQQYKKAYVISMTAVANKTGRTSTYTYNYALMIDGKQYQVNNSSVCISAGHVMDVNFVGNAVTYIYQEAAAETTSSTIQAIDDRRVKLDGNIYLFRSDMAVYCKDVAGNITQKGTSQIDTSLTYTGVSVYLDKAYDQGGKVALMVISQ